MDAFPTVLWGSPHFTFWQYWGMEMRWWISVAAVFGAIVCLVLSPVPDQVMHLCASISTAPLGLDGCSRFRTTDWVVALTAMLLQAYGTATCMTSSGLTNLFNEPWVPLVPPGTSWLIESCAKLHIWLAAMVAKVCHWFATFRMAILEGFLSTYQSVEQLMYLADLCLLLRSWSPECLICSTVDMTAIVLSNAIGFSFTGFFQVASRLQTLEWGTRYNGLQLWAVRLNWDLLPSSGLI